MPDTTQTSETVDARGSRRTLQGRVIGDTASAGRTQKTVTVEVVRRYRDPVYGKYIKRRRRHHAHDENHTYKTGDLVEITESRPLSRTKSWALVSIDERSAGVDA